MRVLFRIRNNSGAAYICQNNADVYILRVRCYYSRLVPFGADPDGGIKIQGTVRIMLTKVTGAEYGSTFSDPEQFRNSIY